MFNVIRPGRCDIGLKGPAPFSFEIDEIAEFDFSLDRRNDFFGMDFDGDGRLYEMHKVWAAHGGSVAAELKPRFFTPYTTLYTDDNSDVPPRVDEDLSRALERRITEIRWSYAIRGALALAARLRP